MKNFNLLESLINHINLYSVNTFSNKDNYLSGMITLIDTESGWKYSFDIEIDTESTEFNISDFEITDSKGNVISEPDDTDRETYQEAFKESNDFVQKYLRAIISRMIKEQ